MRSIFSPAVEARTSALPWQLEEAQEAVSVIYALMTQFLDSLLISEHRSAAVDTINCVADTMFWLLEVNLLPGLL